MRYKAWLVTFTLAGIWGVLLMAQQPKALVPEKLPDDWRTWVHIKTGVIGEKHPLYEAFGGVHHIYANKVAAEAYLRAHKTGEKKRFPDGSAIVFALYEAKDENGMIVAGEKKVVAIMIKDSKRYAATGGWGWQAWTADGKPVVTDPVEQCYTCHIPMRDNDYVFSEWKP